MNKISTEYPLSATDAAKYAQVSYYTVLRWINADHLPAKKIRTKGRRTEWRIQKTDLDRLLEEFE